MTDQTISNADTLDQDVRLYVFRQAADTARVPSPGEIASALSRPQPEIEESLRRLAAGRVLILAPGTTNIWAANPYYKLLRNHHPSNSGKRLSKNRRLTRARRPRTPTLSNAFERCSWTVCLEI